MADDKIRIPCLLCKGEAGLVLAKQPGYQEPTTFEIYHCGFCNTSFSLPRIDASAIYDLIYQNARIIPGYSRYWKYAEEIACVDDPLAYLAGQEEMYWAVRESLLHISAGELQRIKILEVGSGLGYLTYALQKAGFNAIGLDISSEAVERAKITYGDYYLNSDLYQHSLTHTTTYDVVILTEVIEHIDDVVSFMKTVKTLLTKNGYILVTTPNKSFYPEFTIWETEVPPIHCWWFSNKSMEYIGEAIDMKVKYINFTDFYNRNKVMIDIRPLCGSFVRNHILRLNGYVIEAVDVSKFKQSLLIRIWKKFAIKTGLRIVLQRFGVMRGKLKECGKEGVTIAAIYYKNSL